MKLGTITLAELLRSKGYADQVQSCARCGNAVLLMKATPKDEQSRVLCASCEQLRHDETVRLYYKRDVA